MKKSILLLVFIVSSILNASGVPAFPYPIKYKQPDGTNVTVLIKGDEFLNWKETTDGYTLLHNKNGGLEYAILDNQKNLVPSGILVSDIEKRDAKQKALLFKTQKKLFFNKEQINISKQLTNIRNAEMIKMQKAPGSTVATEASSASNAFPTTGPRKLICILMGFANKPFTKTQLDFNNLFNQINYTVDGATGSVKEYHLENSYNQFNLTVDVAGPYTATNNLAYYGNNTNGNAGALITEAVTFADPTVNFADYDNDNDQIVDGVYVIFAGFGEESGGGSNPDAIWSHASTINYVSPDGVTIRKYSCSPEFRGNSGTSITRIGVICHEFGHVLGAPDYYDTNYNNTLDGQYDGTGSWDMMAGGSWNNGGATPAHHNGWTKVMYFNWAGVTTLNSPRSVTLSNAEENTNSFYKINTSTEGEYYFIENRQKHKFDASLQGSGMIIYHVHSGVLNVGNQINVTHPQRMYPIAQNATQDPTGLGTYGTINSSTCAWSGTGKTSFSDTSIPSSKAWNGANSYKPITGISSNTVAKTVSFTFMGGNSCTPPSTQASNLTTTNIQDNQVTVNWTRGNGGKVIVLARRNSAVNTTPLNGTTFTANSIFGSGDLIDAGTYVVYNGTGTSVTITDLLKKSTYYFAVFEYNTADNCYLSPALTGNALTTGCTPCTPSSATDFNYGIENVSFNTINNPSAGRTVYTNYAEVITEVIPGSSYNLAVSNYSYTNTMYTKAWIDWNNDCVFQTNEEYNLGISTGEAIVSLSITVPSNAYSGLVTMRVRTNLLSDPTSCGENDYSDAEDYTLKIVGGCTPPTLQASNFSTSNIQKEQMTINWSRGNGNKVLVVAHKGSAVDIAPIGADLTANADFGAGAQIGTGNYVVYNGTNNNVTVSGLIPGTTYYYAIYEYNTPTNCILLTALTGNATTTASCSLCIPTATSDDATGITNVSINAINNSSLGTPAYSDFRYIKSSVVKGITYNLSVKVNTDGNVTTKTKAWIDWNKDCTIQTSTEEYDLGDATNVTDGLTSLSPLSVSVPTTSLGGTTIIRIRTRYSSLPTLCDNNNYSEAEDYTLNVINPSTTWNGSAWTAMAPTSTYDVVIDGNYNNAGFTCNNLSVNPGKQLTITAGSTLIVNGNLLLQSDEVNGTATFVNNGTVNETIKGTVQQYLATTRNWYVSSPVSNATIPSGYTSYLYRESGDNTGYTGLATANWKSVAVGEPFIVGLGYIALPAHDGLTLTFNTGSAGHINDGDVTIPLTRTVASTKPGYNLVGNPYPSYIDWITTQKTGLSTTMWYRTRLAGGAYTYYTYNTAGESDAPTGISVPANVTNLIPPMQAFWVKVTGTSGSIKFLNTSRAHQDAAGSVFRTPAANAITNKVLRLQLSNGTYSDETVVYFNANASIGFDNYDSPKMLNDNTSAISEIYTREGNEKLVINGMNNIPYNVEIPFYFKINASKSTSFTLAANELSNFEEGTSVYIKNNLTGEHQLISDGSSYVFESDAAINDPAFSLIIKAPGSITDIKNADNDGVFIYGNANKQIVIYGNKLSDKTTISVYNSVGQKIANMTITKDKNVIDVPVSGVYLVTINNEDLDITRKIIIK